MVCLLSLHGDLGTSGNLGWNEAEAESWSQS
jgi:hypothetical protein